MEITQFEPSRDRFGRPMITPEGGGKAVPYTRCTTFVDVLEDKYNLQKWMQRMVAVGIATRTDLHLAAASLATNPEENKQRLDEVCESAIEAAKGSAKATIGTALHHYIEQINLGQPLGHIPAEYQGHIDTYRETVKGIEPVHVERFTVCDSLQIGGTPDIIAKVPGQHGLMIVDLKTGPSTLKYGALKVAMQMAVYAHSKLYVDNQGGRETIQNLRQDLGLVVALDSDTAKCTLHTIDLEAGWEAVQVAAQVRAWRKHKHLIGDYPLPTQPTQPIKTLQERTLHEVMLEAIRECPSRDELLSLWEKAGDKWVDEYTEAAKVRLTELEKQTNTTRNNN